MIYRVLRTTAPCAYCDEGFRPQCVGQPLNPANVNPETWIGFRCKCLAAEVKDTSYSSLLSQLPYTYATGQPNVVRTRSKGPAISLPMSPATTTASNRFDSYA